jgi:hypothetical protein
MRLEFLAESARRIDMLFPSEGFTFTNFLADAFSIFLFVAMVVPPRRHLWCR